MPFPLQSALACDFQAPPPEILLEDIWESHCHGLPRGFSCAGGEKQTAANKKTTELMWVQHLTEVPKSLVK